MKNIKPTALITGVSSGIGKALVEALLREGYQVFGSVRKAKDAEELVAYSDDFVPLIFDVTDTEALSAAVKQLEVELHGRGLSALINNAGISSSGPLLHQSMDEFKKVFEINVFGLLNVTKAVLPLLGACKGFKQTPGRIINIGSVSGGMTLPFLGAYSASKHAVEAISQALRREMIPYGIEVCTVEPGMIQTDLMNNQKANETDTQYSDTDYREIWDRFNQSLEESMKAAKAPSTVTDRVITLLNASKPKPRNPLDPLWYIAKVLPDRVFDKVILKALKLNKLMATKVNKN